MFERLAQRKDGFLVSAVFARLQDWSNQLQTEKQRNAKTKKKQRKPKTHVNQSQQQKSSRPAGGALSGTLWGDTQGRHAGYRGRCFKQQREGSTWEKSCDFSLCIFYTSFYLTLCIQPSSVDLRVSPFSCSTNSAPCRFGALVLQWLVYAALFCFVSLHVFLGLHWLFFTSLLCCSASDDEVRALCVAAVLV